MKKQSLKKWNVDSKGKPMNNKARSEAGRLLSAGNNAKAGKARWAGKTGEEKKSHIEMMNAARKKKAKKLQDC